MKLSILPFVALMCTATFVHAESFTIAGFTFDQASVVKTATVVEGPNILENHSNKNFGKYSEDYLRSPSTSAVNEFAHFDRTKTVGYLIGGLHKASGTTTARHVSLNAPAGTRATLELTWGMEGLPNGKGPDFCVYESGHSDVYAVSVRKAGANEFSPYYYKFMQRDDRLHSVNATAFDLTDFGFTEGDVCGAIRIRNVWSSSNRAGADRVKQESGEGMIVSPTNPEYKNAFPIRIKSGGAELLSDQVDPDIVYVVALRTLVPTATPKKDDLAAEAKK